jgi:hypothetical protein
MSLRPHLANSIALFAALLAATVSHSQPAAGTRRLAAHLKGLRGRKSLTAAEYRALQSEYLDWIDARVKAGISVAAINSQLRAAGLLFHWSNSAEEYSRSHTGYLEPVTSKRLRGAPDLFVIKAAVYKGVGCDLDTPVAIYKESPLQRVGVLSAGDSESGAAYHLSGVDAARRGAAGEWLVASGWTVSNCASTWNDKRVRIDALSSLSASNLLSRNLYAQDRDRAEDVAVWVQNDLVTFWYQGGIEDSQLQSAPAVLRYRITAGQAVREGPLALTRAGFLQEWLKMESGDADRWSEPPAADVQKSVSGAFARHAFTWDRIARCGDTPQVWELAVRLEETNALYVFRVSGSRASELRMLSVGDRPTDSCQPAGLGKNLQAVGAELPW